MTVHDCNLVPPTRVYSPDLEKLATRLVAYEA